MPIDVPSFSAAAAAAAHKRDHVLLQAGHGQTNIVTRDRNPLSRVVQWMSPDKADNRSSIRALHGAMRAQYGNAIGDAVHGQFLQAKEAAGKPLSARRVEVALHAAQTQHLEAQLTTALNDPNAVRTADVRQLANQLKAHDPAAYTAFFSARLGSAATPAREFTLAYLAVPDAPSSFGAPSPLPHNRIDLGALAGTNVAALHAQTAGPHAEAAVIERFHGLPHLDHKYGAFTVAAAAPPPPGINMAPLATGLNGVESARLDAKLNATHANLAANAHAVAAEFGLTPEATNKYLQRLADKVDYADFKRTPLSAEMQNGKLSTLRLVASEYASPAQTDTAVRGLNQDEQLKLLADCVNPNSAYPGLREGTDRIMSAIDRDPNAAPALKAAIGQLRTGYWSGDDFATAVDAEITQQQAAPPPGPPLNRMAVTTACNLAADNRVTGMETDLNNRRAGVNNLLTTLLAEVTAGRMNAAQFKTATGLSETQARAVATATQNPLTHAEATRFAQLFGSSLTVPAPVLPGAAANAVVPPPQRAALEGLAQMFSQAHALASAPARYINGLDHMALALPTAGKPLSELTYAQTLAQELDRTLTTGGVAPGAGRRGYPILIFDQSTPALLAQNQQTLAAIGQQHNVRVESISMQNVTDLGNKLGLAKMFDTTGAGYAGYAGARNIANLAALVFNAAIKQDPNRTVADVINLPAQTLKTLLHTEMGNGKTVLMGDDDASLRPGFLHAKALITDEHPNEYITSKTVMDGRGTTAGLLLNQAGQVGLGIGFVKSIAMGAAAWSDVNINPVMAGALSSPGACLNLPVPTEESHFAAYDGVRDILGKATHHSGDRYEDPGVRVKNFISYTHQGALADVLLDCGNNYHSSAILPWNDRNKVGSPAQDPARSLFSILDYAKDAPVKQGMQLAFFDNLLKFETTPRLAPLVGTDYTTAFGALVPNDPTEERQISEARDAFLATQADVRTAVRFRDQLNQRLTEAFNALPPAQQQAGWAQISARLAAGHPTATTDAIQYLINHDHDALITGAADQARLDLQQPLNPLTGHAQTAVDVNTTPTTTPLARIVFLATKSIGGGEFNDLARTAVT
jgi:hypothetical protein